MITNQIQKPLRSPFFRGAFVASLLVGVSIFAYFFHTGRASFTTPSAGTLSSVVLEVNGYVWLKSGKERKRIEPGQILQERDVIHTEKNSSTEISFAHGAIIRLKNKTEVILSRLAKADEKGSTGEIVLNLRRGNILNYVRKMRAANSFTIITPMAIAAVQGTSFEVIAEGKISSVLVAEGKVEVTSTLRNQEIYSLEKNQSVTISNKRTPVGVQFKSNQIALRRLEYKEMENHLLYGIASHKREMKATTKHDNQIEAERELAKKYKKNIEIISMVNGQKIRGIVVEHDKGRLVIQSVNGRHIIKEIDVTKIEYAQE